MTVKPHTNPPARAAVTLTPHDSTNFTVTTRGLHVNTGGTMVALFAEDNATVTMTVNSGTTYPYQLKRIDATSTTASGFIGLY